MNDELINEQTADTQSTTTAEDYIEAIKNLKQTTVDKSAYVLKGLDNIDILHITGLDAYELGLGSLSNTAESHICTLYLVLTLLEVNDDKIVRLGLLTLFERAVLLQDVLLHLLLRSLSRCDRVVYDLILL